ncbi:MAG: PAS domain-containing protein [Campylobacter sp.]|nr:PAS domain-containing protein [Campylobacter sp.]
MSAEIKLADNTLITSKTDLTGRITYANRDFLRYAGYELKEILGVQHNIVRHKDMPRAAFWLLWELLKKKEEFFGFVKNKAKNGDFYWVFANITPSFNDKGEVVSYYSVRRKPSKNGVKTAEEIYAELLKAEGEKGDIKAGVNRLLELLGGADYNEFVLNLQLGGAQ